MPPTDDHAGKGNYLGFLEVAKRRARGSKTKSNHNIGGAVLEVQIPSEELIVIADRKMPKQEFHNLTELRNEYKHKGDYQGPEAFWRDCQDTDVEKVHFKVKGSLKTDWITGVWDTENSQKPIFVPLEDFLKTLASQYTQEMPGKELAEKERQEILQEMEVYKELLQALKNTKDSFDNLEHPPIGKDREQLTAEYNEALENANKVLAEEFGFEPNPAEASYEEVRENSQEVESLITDAAEGLKEALADEQQHIHENWDKEKMKEEKIFEKRLEKDLADKVMRIPVIMMR